MLLRGRWLAGHVLVIVVAATFVALGFWQLARHHEKQDKVRAARAAYAAPAPELRGGSTVLFDGETRVQATGVYDATREVLLRNRVRDGKSGADLLTPLRLDDGTVVFVDRGWVSAAAVDAGLPEAAPPTGTVIVRGLARASRPTTEDDTVDERAGRLRVPRVDLERIAQETGVEPHAIWIEAQSQQPAPDPNAPRLPQPPPPDQVNHLQYAIQWWSFALVPLVGWPILLVRLRHQHNRLDAAGRQGARTRQTVS